MTSRLESGQDIVRMKRGDKQYHIVVTEEMHLALKNYAARNKISLSTAASRILRTGFTAELIREKRQHNPEAAEINKLINEMARKSLKDK